jgi:hypothetical protein
MFFGAVNATGKINYWDHLCECRRISQLLIKDFYLIHTSDIMYSSPSIVRVIKARRMRWAGHVVRMGGSEGCIQHFCWEA